MKKIILIVLVISIVYSSNAQKQFYPGIKVAGSLSNWSTDESVTKVRASYTAGITGSFKLTKQFIVQPEILYSSVGPIVEETKFHFNYLHIPILFKYQTLGGFYGEMGPQSGYLLSAKSISPGTTIDLKNSIKSYDFSLAFGLGYKLKSGVEIGARQTIGITKIGGDVKNNVFSLGLAYTFGDSR